MPNLPKHKHFETKRKCLAFILPGNYFRWTQVAESSAKGLEMGFGQRREAAAGSLNAAAAGRKEAAAALPSTRL